MTTALAKTGLSPEQVRHYRSEGYVMPLTALSPTEAGRYRGILEAFEQEHGTLASQILRQKSHLALRWVNDLIRLDSILDPVESILGPNILCWATSFFIKNPGDKKYIAWHQDAQYWGIESDDVVTAWLALTPSNQSNGCMRFVPRSHLHIVPHAEKVNADNMLSRGQEIAVEVDEADTVDDILAPGQFSLHHEQLIHGSNRNTGNERRIGLAIRYLRPTARQVVEDKDTATLVRGVDPHGNFEPERRPAHDMEPDAVDYLEALLARRGNGVFALRRS